MRAFRRRWTVTAVAVLVAISLIVAGVIYLRPRERKREAGAAHKPEAPPDLAKLRDRYLAGVQAVRAKDGAKAVQTLAAFTFGKRWVEEYRLYYLARGYELANDH